MRSIRPFRLPALLLAAALAAPAAAQIPMTVDASHLRGLQARLDGFAAALPPAERAAWDRLLLRAASAPAEDPAAVRVTPVLEIGPGGGCDGGAGADEAAGRVAIIVQGGRTASPTSGIIVQGGRTPSGPAVQGARPSAGAVRPVQRPSPAGTVAIGPKPEDPTTPPRSLGRRLAALSSSVSPQERAALNWLLTRAAAAEVRPGAPGGLPPGPCGPETGCRPPVGGSPLAVSLRQALGIDALAIGPKPEDPSRPPPPQRWMLRY